MQEEITPEEQEEIRSTALLNELDRIKGRFGKHRNNMIILIVVCCVFAVAAISSTAFFMYKKQGTKTQMEQLVQEKDSLALYNQQLVATNKLLFSQVDSLKSGPTAKFDNNNPYKIQIGAFKSPAKSLQKDFLLQLKYDETTQLYKFYISGFEDRKEANIYIKQIRKLDMSKAFFTK